MLSCERELRSWLPGCLAARLPGSFGRWALSSRVWLSASCANSVALSHTNWLFPAPNSPSPISILYLPTLITHFPKINMHCELHCKTHLRGAANWLRWAASGLALGWLAVIERPSRRQPTAVAMAVVAGADAAEVDVDGCVIVNRSNGLH